jgi:hypothetical protein
LGEERPSTLNNSLKPIFAFLGVDLRDNVAVRFVGLEKKKLFHNVDIVGFLIFPEIFQ